MKANIASCQAVVAASHHNCISATPANTAASKDRSPIRSAAPRIFA
jgi:hypothetical protein